RVRGVHGLPAPGAARGAGLRAAFPAWPGFAAGAVPVLQGAGGVPPGAAFVPVWLEFAEAVAEALLGAVGPVPGHDRTLAGHGHTTRSTPWNASDNRPPVQTVSAMHFRHVTFRQPRSAQCQRTVRDWQAWHHGSAPQADR